MGQPKGYGKGLTVEGLVIQAVPGALALRCYIFMSKRIVTCTCGNNSAVVGNSTRDVDLPVEGTVVSIHLPSLAHTSGGVILAIKGRIKTGNVGKERKIKEVASNSPAQDVTQVKDVDYYKESVKRKDMVWANGGNSSAVLPGDWLKGTPYGVMFYLSKFWCTVKASERASLEMFMFNDTVRLRSGSYQHFSAQGDEYSYNDEGHLTRERGWSLRNNELYGSKEETKEFKETSEWGDKQSGVEVVGDIGDAIKNALAPLATKKKRKNTVYEYEGSLASMRQEYTVNVADDKQISFKGQHNKGSKVSVTCKGVKQVLAPKMIPETPIRLLKPEDPAGDKNLSDLLEDAEAGKEFNYDATNHNTHLQELDARIFELKQLMYKFDKLEKDFSTDKKVEMELGAGHCINEDGSVSWWDKAGSNICMDGKGDIIIAPKNNLVLQPGGSLVGLVPGELTLRAKKSIDLTADENDIRLRAKKNLQVLSSEGAVLLESQAEGGPYLQGKGTTASGKGIIIKSREGGILLDGKQIWVTCDTWINQAKNKAITYSKAVYNAGDRVYNLAKNAALSLSAGSATLVGKSANVLGSSASVISGSNAARIDIPIQGSPYSSANSQLNAARDSIKASTEPVTKAGDKAHFSYNNSNHPVSKLNQTMAQMIDHNLKLDELSDDWDLDEPKETEHNTTPWPGFSADFEYIKYYMTNNLNDDRTQATGEAGASSAEKEYKVKKESYEATVGEQYTTALDSLDKLM